MASKLKSPSTTPQYANHRYLSTPEKIDRIQSISKTNGMLRRKVRLLKVKLDEAMKTSAVSIDNDLSNDFQEIMQENSN